MQRKKSVRAVRELTTNLSHVLPGHYIKPGHFHSFQYNVFLLFSKFITIADITFVIKMLRYWCVRNTVASTYNSFLFDCSECI